MKSLRKKVASKAKKVVAQGLPKVTDEGPEGDAPKAPAGQPPAGGGQAPAPKAPAGKPDDAAAEEKAEKEIKEEKEEEAKLESVGDKLDKLIESIDTMTKAQEDVKKILEKKLLDKTEEEEDFEEFKDEDDDIDEFSAEEFGVDDLVTSSEEEKMASLREKRNARLKKFAGRRDDKQAAAAEGPSDTIGEEFDYDKAKKKTFSPKAPAPQITKVKKSEIPDKYKLATLTLSLNASEDRWILATNEDGEEKPIYEIEKTDENKDNFATKEFATEIFKEMKQEGVASTLEKLGAKEVTADDKETNKLKKDTDVNIPDVEVGEGEKEEKSTDYRRRFNRAYRLALSAMNQNLIKANPLKHALFANLEALGIDDQSAFRAIESAFAKAADEHFEIALAQAEDYMKLSDEAFVETESAIGELETRNIQSDSEVAEDNKEVTAAKKPQLSDKAMEMQARAERASMLLSTASKDSGSVNKFEALQNALPKPKLTGVGKLVRERF